MRAEHDDDRPDAARARHRRERVLEQRPAAQGRELLGRSEPAPFARGQDEPADRLHGASVTSLGRRAQ